MEKKFAQSSEHIWEGEIDIYGAIIKFPGGRFPGEFIDNSITEDICCWLSLITYWCNQFLINFLVPFVSRARSEPITRQDVEIKVYSNYAFSPSFFFIYGFSGDFSWTVIPSLSMETLIIALFIRMRVILNVCGKVQCTVGPPMRITHYFGSPNVCHENSGFSFFLIENYGKITFRMVIQRRIKF
jgi:hypothetical protein